MEATELLLQDVIDLNRDDPSFFGKFCMPDVFLEDFPDFYIEVWNHIIKELVRIQKEAFDALYRFALGLPRGHAKTTFCKILIAYGLTHGLIEFPLIVGASEKLAQNILDDIASILSSQNFLQTYGDFKAGLDTDSREVKSGTWMGRSIIMVAVGAGTAMRGLNLQNRRPDFILMDDVQTKENDESPAQRDALLTWIIGTLLKARSYKHCFVCFIGNMYSEDCILAMLQKNKRWVSLITGAILQGGEVLWEAVRNLDSLLDEFEHDSSMGKGEIWFTEVQNDPRSGKKRLLTEIKPHPWGESDPPIQASFITVDPAGFEDDADQNVAVAHGIAEDLPFIHKIRAGNWDPEQTVTNTIELAIETHATLIAVENVAYQSSLKFWIDKYLKELSLENHITVIGVNPAKRHKQTRIKTWCDAVDAGGYQVLRAEERAVILWQAMQYVIGKKDNSDDILDACSYGLDIIASRREELEFQFHQLPHLEPSVADQIESISILNIVPKRSMAA